MPSYQDGIIAGLAKKGYMIGPAAKDGKVTLSKDDCPGALIALSVYREQETNVNNIYDDTLEVLKEMKAYYYSVVISHSYEATWVGPNFSIPAKSKPTPPAPPLPPKKNVN
jgi:hypothetical protein